jgi:ubiquinone/menaquinone biosynthesis C-methylase UbiE
MIADTTTLLVKCFDAAVARTIADIGCGDGALAARLSDCGYSIVGIDPSEAAIEVARKAAPSARFEVAKAEALPMASGTVDGVLFHNSLHHVPVNVMGLAFRETARILSPRGRVTVVEPAAHGPLFETIRPIEDETEVRAAAEKAVRSAVETGLFDLVETIVYERSVSFTDVEQLLGHLLEIDATRANSIDRERKKVGRLFEANGVKTTGGYMFEQQQTLFVLAPAGAI